MTKNATDLASQGTAALKAVSGLLKASDGTIDDGEIFFEGGSIKDLRTDQLVTKGLSLVPEGRRVFPTMTVLENLEMGAFTRNDKAAVKSDVENVLTFFPPLKERLYQKAGTLSTGEQQMLAIGRALMLKPKLLLADEPSLGLSPNYVELIFDKFTEINKNGTSILLVEQNAMEALRTAHRAYVFNIGAILLSGTCSGLLTDETVRKSYLGG
jgi:branched-chain amino acid transport system ATP-binding protein